MPGLSDIGFNETGVFHGYRYDLTVLVTYSLFCKLTIPGNIRVLRKHAENDRHVRAKEAITMVTKAM